MNISPLTVSELKSAIVRDPLVVQPDLMVIDAIAEMTRERSHCHTSFSTAHIDEHLTEVRSSCVLVVEDDKFIGILTERDIVRLSGQQIPLDQLRIRDVMVHPVVSLRESNFTDVLLTINLLQQHHIRHLPIVDEQDRLVGLITHESLRQSFKPMNLLRLRPVADVMTSNVICAAPHSSMLEIAQQMTKYKVSCIMLVEPLNAPSGGKSLQCPVGMVTERDLVQFQSLGLSLKDCTAASVMSTPVFAIAPDASLRSVQEMMEQQFIRRLAVTGQQGELLGIITQSNLLQALNPLELYHLAEILETKVSRLETEKILLLENRNVELEQQVEVRTQSLIAKVTREKMVTQIADRIRRSLNLQEILDTCVADLREFIQCDRLLVYQFQPDWSGIILAESVEDGVIASLGNQINDFCFHARAIALYQQNEPIVVNNIYAVGYSSCHIEQLERYQVKANLVVPINLSGQLWGLLIAHQCNDYRHWQTDEAKLLQDISIQLAIAIQQSLAYQQVQHQLAELTTWRNRYEAAERASGQMLYEYDFVNDAIVWGANAELITGYPPASMPNTFSDWLALIHPEDQVSFQQLVEPSFTNKTPFLGQYRIRHQAGHYIWVEDRNQWLMNGEGEGIGLIGMIADISDRKQAEEALKASEAHQRALIEAIPDLFMRANREGIYLEFASIPNQHRIVGDLADMRGTHVSETLPPELAQKRMEFVERALQTQSLQTYEQDLSTEENIHVEEVRVVPYNENEVLLIARDISDRKINELKLAKSEAHLQKIATTVPGMLYTLVQNPDGSVEFTYISPPAAEILEIDIAEALADSSLLLNQIHPDDLAGYIAAGEQSLANMQNFQHEWRIITPSGKIKWLQANAQIERLENQQVNWVGIVLDVTERKQAENDLKRTTQLFREAQRIAHFGNWEHNLIENTLYWSDEVFRIFEIDPQQVTLSYEVFLNAVHPDDLEWVDAGYTKSLSNRTPYNVIHRLLMPDGRIKYIQAQCETLYAKDGIPLRAQGTVIDITSLKMAELELERINTELEERVNRLVQERETRYRTLMDGASDAIILADLQGYILECNSKSEELLGYSRDELATMHFSQLHPPEDLPDIIIAFERFAKQEIAQVFDVNFLSKNGEVIPVDISASVIEFDGKPIAQGIFRDIRDRKKIEQALRQSEERFRRMFDSNAVGMIFADFQGHIIDTNDRFLDMIGYSRQDLESGAIDWMAMTPEEYLAKDYECMEQLTKYGEVTPWEKEYYRKDGSRIAILIGAALLQGSNNEAICVIIDISDRKQTEDQLRKLSHRLNLSLQAGAIGSWEWSLGNEVVWDQRSYEIHGLQNLDRPATYQDWFTMLHPDDISLINQRLQEVVVGKQQVDMEFRIHRPDGALRWIRSMALGQFDAQGQLVKMTGINQDITERKLIEEQLQQQAKQKQLLLTITQSIRQSLDIDDILHTAVTEVRQLLEVDRVAIYRFQSDWSGEFIIESRANGWVELVSDDVNKIWEDTYLQETHGGRFRNHETMTVNDIYQADLQLCHIDLLEQFQARAYVITPIFVGDSLWGLFAMYHNNAPHEWTIWEIDLLEQIANQLAIAIYQANLYQQVQTELKIRQQAEAAIAQQLNQQRTLGAITQRIRESLDINEILATVTQQVKNVLQCDRVIVFRLYHDGRSQIVEERVSSEFASLKNQHWEDEVWSQEILDCYWQGQPRIVPDVMNDIWTDCLVDYSREGQIQSKIVAPILQELHEQENHRWVDTSQDNKLWGVLVVHACQEKRVWQDAEAQVLQQIANQLAIAIQQASLFEQVQRELSDRQKAQQQLTRTNQQLALSNEELARATRLKDEFLANMSHELRTPLNAILGITEGLVEEVFGILNDQQKSVLHTIERSGNHLLELINDILDLAKIESGKVILEVASTNIHQLCQSSVVFVTQQAIQKQIQLNLNLASTIPDLMIDERRIRQVLINLLNNAVKFTQSGGRINLDVSLESNANPNISDDSNDNVNYWVTFTVTDTGIGITPENLKKLFQPFIQVDSALNRKYEGTGLGLALVKRIVELHGGYVYASSEFGVGSRFTIALPCNSDHLPPSFTELTNTSIESMTLSVNNEDKIAPPLILLAEDNEANIITISSYLQAKGYRLIIAKDGKESVDLVISEQPDLVLMDIQMPGMDGIEAIKQIRSKNFIDLPIIAVTALAMTGDRERCIEAGANDYLSKPIKLKQLAATIQQFL
ncbi:PAS domain S-box protein [Pseudanabaena sp. Chao 1811]|uniref:PAS domain S-box protein n=1 Tax=Pseudanabaena sp. Chao 1811 TaxID=2963092 RepID=UPI0022F3B50B|nr:PAS domain S-box protein [Pseudanabaena sp. Chao 1811]